MNIIITVSTSVIDGIINLCILLIDALAHLLLPFVFGATIFSAVRSKFWIIIDKLGFFALSAVLVTLLSYHVVVDVIDRDILLVVLHISIGIG